MSRQELLSPEGLRIDGRRANELRRISCRASVLNSADGSAYYEQGNTKVLVAVYGPREPRAKTQFNYDQAIVNVEFNVAPFSTSERRKRSKGDKRLLEISSFVKQTFEGAIQRNVYPRSQIDIYIHLLQHDGGTLETCINAATLALVDAGVSMSDYVCACTAGFIDDTPVLDLNGVEESSIETPDLTVAILPRTGNIALLQMESKLHSTKLQDVMDLALEGCKHIHKKLDDAVLAAANDLAAKLVVSSADIGDSCQVNNLESLAELLAPFGQDVSTQITIQDGQGAPYFLDKINVKFVSDFTIEKQRQPSNAEVDELVKSCVSGGMTFENADPSFIKDGSGIDKEAAASDDISAWSPWYTLFRQQWVNNMRASEHESFMHPVACLLAVSGSDPDPVRSLRALANDPTVRRAQMQSFAGANLMLFYMVVHDERRATDAHNVDHRFDQVRKAFGQNCSLLKINSNTDLLGSPDSLERAKISGIWTSSLASLQPIATSPDKAYGGMLAMRDVAALRDAVKQMMVRSVIPHMQYVVRLLSDQTANQRRGITGRLFSAGRRYFGNSGKTGSTLTGVDGDTYFRYDSPEAMMRQLADYSFMLKDFRFAQSVYQVARRDFLAEKAWKCYAGAQEMVGLCKLMWEVQATKAEFDSNFDDAATTYLHKTHSPHPFLAIRSVILYYELLKHHRMLAYAPVALLRVPRVHVSLNALMSEQAAYSFLKFAPRPEVRKFSFYAMVASQQFQRAEMGELAHRCLRMVRHALATPSGLRSQRGADEDEKAGYEEEKKPGPGDAGGTRDSSSEVTACSSWAAIDSFVNHELGKQCMAAQSYDEAFQYFMALMSDDKIPPKLQNKYLQELLQLFLESDDQAALQSTEEGSRRSASVQLSIPDIDPHMARIIMSPELEGDDGMLEWRLDGSTPVSSSADSSAAARSLQQNGHKCCAVGETVAVLLVVTNPLTIGVTLNSFTLDCEFAAAGEQDGDVAAFEVSTVPSVILEGGQTSMVTVEIVARQTGELSIAGAKFLLCDILPTYKSLRLPGRRLNDTKEQRMALAYSPETSLGFRVDPELPHLHVAMHDFPDTLMSGSVHKAAIHIVNQGSLACRGMVLWLSHPSFFDIKSPHLLSDEATNAALSDVYQRQAAVSETETLSVNNALQDCSEFLLVGDARQQLAGARHLVPVESLAPGETLVVPLWARGDRVGDHSLRLSIGSCADAAALQAGVSRVMRSRTFDVDLLVTPSLRVNAFVRPSTRSPQERLLGIEVENMQADMSVQLIQTTFSSGHYRLEPIFIAEQKAVPGGQVVIGPRQTVNLMYRARPYRANKQGGGVLEKSSPAQTAVPEWFAINALRKYIYSNEKPKQLPEPIELIYSNAVLGDHEGIDCVHSSLQNYIVRSQSHRRRNMLRANYPMIPERFHHVLFPLFETFGIDFVLFWAEIGGAARSGHHSITGIDLGVPHDYINEALNPPEEGAARAWLANTVNEREALIHSIANRASAMANRHERTIDVAMRVLSVSRGIRDTGDEASSIMSIADVGITVRNHSWRYGYKVRLDLFSPADLGQLVTDKIRLDYSGSRSSWSWLEKPDFLIVVGPQESVEVGAKLACLTSGVVDIGLWKLRAVALEPSKDGAVSIESAAAKAQYSSKNLECTIYPVLPYFVSIDTLE